MYILFTDSDTDITPKVAAYYGYHMISMPYIIDEKEIYPYIDFEEFNYHEFYELLRKGTLPKTCGISPQQHMDYFEPFLKEGKDILYVHFSAAMSGTFNAMYIAIEMLKEKYPNNKIHTIDTKGITLGSYNIVLEIGELYKQGKSIEEIKAWAEVEVDKFAVYFYADNLTFFKRSGRVSGFSATMGNIFGIHPIIFMDSDGMMKSIGKEKGRLGSLRRLVTYVEDLGDDIYNHRVLIGHSDALSLAETLGDMLKAKFGDKLNIEYVVVNPTAGSHCGPSSIGVSFHAIHR